MTGSELYPAFLDLEGKRVLVVGGGAVATRKVRTLVRTGAKVVVVAPEICEALRDLAAHDTAVRFEPRRFDADDVVGCTLVFVATGDFAVDSAVLRAAREAGALVNLANDPDECDFLVPASGSRGAIQVAVGTAGTSPSLAVRLRDRFLGSLGPEWERFAGLLGEVRREARAGSRPPAERQRLLARAAADDGLLAAVARGEEVGVTEVLEREEAGGWDATARDCEVPQARLVSLVGGGPGAPELLTIAGRDAISSADVVVYDDLVDRRMLSCARDGAELIYAGKRGWREGPERPDTGELLVRKAREGAGKRVVRLKGGDPLVFGRAGEEIATLAAAGVPFEIIPGVTAALAAAAGSRIPLTLRGVSNSLTLVAGNSATESAAAAAGAPESDGESGPPVASLVAAALAGGTLCVYMGLKGLPRICAGLVASGIEADLPVAIVEGASSPGQRTVVGTLTSIEGVAARSGVASPALVIIGRVVDYAPWLRRLAEDAVATPVDAE